MIARSDGFGRVAFLGDAVDPLSEAPYRRRPIGDPLSEYRNTIRSGSRYGQCETTKAPKKSNPRVADQNDMGSGADKLAANDTMMLGFGDLEPE